MMRRRPAAAMRCRTLGAASPLIEVLDPLKDHKTQLAGPLRLGSGSFVEKHQGPGASRQVLQVPANVGSDRRLPIGNWKLE